MDTREQILAAAATVFAQHGFRGSTTRRIADAAAVNEVTIFRYFGSKDVLLEEAVRLDSRSPLSHLLPEVPVDPERELTNWSEAVREHLHSKRSLIRKCMGELEERPGMMSCAKQAPVRSTNHLCKYFERLRKHGFTRENQVDPMVAAAMLMGTIFHDAMGREMMPEAMPKPAGKAISQYVRLLLNGLGVKKRPSKTTMSTNTAFTRGRHRVLVGVFAALSATASLGAQTSQSTNTAPIAVSLDDAIRIGESKSEAVQVARAGLRRSVGQQYQARSQFLPQIYGSGGYTRTLRSQFQGAFGGGTTTDTTTSQAPATPCDQYLRDANASVADRLAGLELASRCTAGDNPFSALSSLPFGQEHQYNLGLSFSQNLFAGGRIAAQNSIANAGHRSAEIELSAQRAQTILDITQAYYDAALSDRLAAIAESSFAQTENVFRQTELNKNVGTVSEFELLRASVSRDNQRPVVIQRRSDRDVAYLRLKQLLDIPLEAALKLTTSIEDSATTPTTSRFATLAGMVANIGDTSAAHRSVVRQAEEGVSAQEGFLKVSRAERLPSLSLTSQYGRVAYPRNGALPSWTDFRANWTVGVAAQIPIFTGGRIRGAEIVAQANLAESRARLQQIREYAALDSRVTLNALEQANASWEASAGTAEQAARAYSIAEVRYREGISTQLELNDSRILLAQAQANRALAARNLQIARVRLALLPNLPLTANASSQSSAAQQQASASQQQQQTQQTQSQNAAAANQQIPPGF